jgi:hypothetical protein
VRDCVEQELESRVKSAERVEDKWEGGRDQWLDADVSGSLVTLCLCAGLMGMLTSFKVLALRYISWIGEMTVTSTKINCVELLDEIQGW